MKRILVLFTTLHHASPRFTTLHHASPRFTTLHHASPRFTTLLLAPKRSIGFGVGGNGKTVLATWYDDVSFEPLDKKN
jgi:hypothetical protein